MPLSVPIFLLKRQARLLARKEKIPLNRALDRIAAREGYRSWSHLAAQYTAKPTARDVLDRLESGSLALIGGRPGQGKTLLGLRLAIESMSLGRRSAFFTLEFTRADVMRHLVALGADVSGINSRLTVDDSDRICADYVIDRLGSVTPNTLVVIDYLQLLDQRRESPPLRDQVEAPKRFARARRSIVVCLSQIDRRYDPDAKPCPDIDDVRLPNPIDLQAFDKACFLSRGRLRMTDLAPRAQP